MNRVSFRQQRAAISTLLQRSSARTLALRPSEYDLLTEHVQAADKVLQALDDHPDIAEHLREKVQAGRRAAL